MSPWSSGEELEEQEIITESDNYSPPVYSTGFLGSKKKGLLQFIIQILPLWYWILWPHLIADLIL